MREKPKLKLKKFYFHPITVFLFLILLIVVVSGILSAFQTQATYNTINTSTNLEYFKLNILSIYFLK